MSRITIAALLAPSLLAAQSATQTPAVRTEVSVPATTPAVSPLNNIAGAVRASRAPDIDGRDDDAAWRSAPVIDQFQIFQPVEGGTPRFRTNVRVVYDDKNLYVLIRSFDPHPDSLKPLLSRRDVRTASDQAKVVIDSYHDRRTGYEFMLNPAGVKRDAFIWNDNIEDMSWDGVWDGAAKIDSLGWVAEFKIPFSQLRFADAPTHTFGFAIWRDVARFNERYSWPLYRPSQFGFVSQLGDLGGVGSLAKSRRLEVTPYTVAKSEGLERAKSDGSFEYPAQGHASVGADIKYGISSNLTLDATINPDFGQVEADPAVLNLSAFETFLAERRPFFLEGTNIFDFALAGNNGGGSPNLFYSRRIGRQPQLTFFADSLGNPYADENTPSSTTILGASKVTGRFKSGLSVGVLDAITQGEEGARVVGGEGRYTVEPRTNYGVVRAQKDFRNGASSIGAMATNVDRSLDEWSDAYLRRTASTGGLDFRHRFWKNRMLEVSGYVAGSRVAGSEKAIARTQRSSTHYFQRPDDEIEYDPTRTSLSGDAEHFVFQKYNGLVRGFTAYTRIAPGFEANDAGFLPQADRQTLDNHIGVLWQRPRWIYNRMALNLFQSQTYTTKSGVMVDRLINGGVNWAFKNGWGAFIGTTQGQLAGSYCVTCTRGGPALRESAIHDYWAEADGDIRGWWTPHLFLDYSTDDEGRSHFTTVAPALDLRLASRFAMSFQPFVARSDNDAQYYGTFGGTHYAFAALDQTTVSAATRIDVTATRNLSLQIYAEPFVSRGRYSNVREIADPKAERFADRFTPYTCGASDYCPSGLDFKQFRSNTVLRWEYRPGSTVFLVWAQGRNAFTDSPASNSVASGYRNLFEQHPRNTFLVKASYWFGL